MSRTKGTTAYCCCAQPTAAANSQAVNKLRCM